MALKENYKDALYDGQRRYRQVPNEDGTVTLVDATSYTQVGDKFGSNDINATNIAVNRLNHVTPVMLTAAGWVGSAAPFTQEADVIGAKAELEAILVSMLADEATVEVQKAYSKAFGIVSGGTATLGDGTATFKVYKKPAADIMVGLKGV